MTNHDVAVVGAGPAGSGVAGRLAARGYNVVVLDRARFPRDKACAEYCSPGVEEVLRRAGAWELVAPEARRVPGMTLYVWGRPVLPVEYSSGVTKRFAFTLPRARLDQLLVDHARACGATVVEETRVVGVARDRNVYRVSAVERSGKRSSYGTRIVIGADGLQSTVARCVGITAQQHWPRRVGLVTHYAMNCDVPDAGQMHVGAGLYCGLAPLPSARVGAGGVVNVGLVMSMDLVHRLRSFDGPLLQTAIARLPAVAAYLESGKQVKRIRGMGPMTRRVDRVAGGGFLLVGDAAGFLDPFTGEGIYRALRGAELAAEAVDEALRSQKTPIANLTAYASMRRAEFTAKESLTWIIQLALSSPSTFGRLCANLRTSPAAARAMGNTLGDIAPAAALLRPAVISSVLWPR